MDDSLCLCSSLKAAASCCERALNDALSQFHISHCQAMILMKIGEGKMSMSDMSRELCCHKSNVTQVVAGLEKKGLLSRAPQAQDRRIAELLLTSKGRTARSHLAVLLSARANESMGMFTKEEKLMLGQLLRKFVEKHRCL